MTDLTGITAAPAAGTEQEERRRRPGSARPQGVIPPFRLDGLLRDAGWTTFPLRIPGDEVLRHAAYVPVAAVGETVSGYFIARVDRAFDDGELVALGRLQGAVIASHGRFLRGPDPTARLTARQQQILQLMQGGLTAGAIASRLGISESTVGKHLRDRAPGWTPTTGCRRSGRRGPEGCWTAWAPRTGRTSGSTDERPQKTDQPLPTAGPPPRHERPLGAQGGVIAVPGVHDSRVVEAPEHLLLEVVQQ